MISATDTELTRRFVEQRADDAFAELVRRHVDVVYGSAMRKVRDPHLAEEVAQAVFTALVWKAPALVRHQTIVGWLHTATRFAANELLRAERRRRHREQEASTMNECLPDPSEPTAREKLRTILDDTMGELNDRDREAVLLRFFAHQSFAAIGATLAISENSARMRVERALDKLHGLLARRGVTSTSSALALVLANQAAATIAPAPLAASVTGAALASATAGMGAGATAAAFLGLGKIQASVAIAATVALCAVFYESANVRRLETERAAAIGETISGARKVAALEHDLAAARIEQLAAQEKLAAVRAKNVATNSTPATASPADDSQLALIRDHYLQRRAVGRSDPEYQRLQTDRRKIEAARNYGPLLQRLKLSAERIRQFESLIAEHAQAIDDIDAAAETKHVALSDPTVERLKNAAQESLKGKISELLGANALAEFERYQRTSLLRCTVTEPVALALYATDSPLTATQAEALTLVLDRHTRLERDDSKNDGGTHWDAALAEAERMLAPTQHAALRAVAAQRQWVDKLSVALSPMVGVQPAAKAGGG